MKHARQILLPTGVFLVFTVLFTGCETTSPGIQAQRTQMAAKIASEPPGDYYIGRRYYKPDFKFWGYVRRPGQPWTTAQLVMLNEKQALAPDRAALKFGSDNNFEYKLTGQFSGEKVYEPASNTIYPEFVLQKIELLDQNPAPIFASQRSGQAAARNTRLTIEKPEL